jgi:oligogalacturonide transport system permease protein
LASFGLIMVYPLLWLFTASFKSNAEIFSSLHLLPSRMTWEPYVQGWNGIGQYGFSLFFFNSFRLVLPVVLFTIMSSLLVAYGFARFRFPFKRVLFTIMLSTLMLPETVIIIPRYILFRDLGWLNSYLPFIIPVIFACTPFFIFMMVQFLRGIPKELDESAFIDGCTTFRILISILIPLCKPVIFAAGIFQFIWTWNDFFNPLIYINSVYKFTVALGLRMALDLKDAVGWNKIMAMSVVAIVPCVLVFFFSQKYFVEGITTTGMKT